MNRMTLALAALIAPSLVAAVDPLSARVQSEDARRFAAVFEAGGGAPTAGALQAGYLDGAGRGVEIFTPGRIRDAEHLAAYVAAHPAKYRRAIDVCLPIAEESTAELRAIYLGLAGLLPGRDLPEIHVVFGAGNSGGTAGPDAQVLGLEVICAIADSEAEIRRTLRKFFAHETVHVLQGRPDDAVVYRDLLVTASLAEGVADFVAWLVTGAPPDPERDAWASGREAELWAQFEADRELIRREVTGPGDEEDASAEVNVAFKRWISNYGSAPEGWPVEVGYWVGRRIAEAYFVQAADKRAAIDALLQLEDPLAILAESGYDPT